MNSQKGQVQVIFVVLLIAAAIFYFFSKLGEEKTLWPSSPSQPVFQGEPVISSPQEQAPLSSSPVADNYSPYRFNGWPAGQALSAQTRKTYISLETDEKAVCRYNTVSGVGYYAMNRVFSDTNSTSHSTEVTGLSEGENYVYYIKCIDNYGNINTDDFLVYFSVKTPADLTPPVRSNQYPSGDIIHYDKTSTIIGISTNEYAYCRYDTQQGIAYKSMRYKMTDDGTMKYHTARITGLYGGQSYGFFVRCKDLAGNVNTGDVMISFTVGD